MLGATLATLGERDGCKLCITLEAVDACWSDILLDVTVTTLGARYVRSPESDAGVLLSDTLLAAAQELSRDGGKDGYISDA